MPALLWGAVTPQHAARILSLKNRGLGELEEGRNAEAHKNFLRLAELVPNEPLPWANAAVAALRSHDIPEAEKLLSRARELAPGRADLLMIAAAIENQKNDAGASRADLARAAALDPRNLEARWRWIQSAEIDPAMAGQTAQEGQYLRQIISLSPSNVPALMKLSLLELKEEKTKDARETIATVEKILAPLDPKVARFFHEGNELLDARDAREAGLKFRIAENLLRVTQPYQQSLAELFTNIVGLPLDSFSPGFEESLRPRAGPPVPVSLVIAPEVPAGLSTSALLNTVDLANTGSPALYKIPAPYRRAAYLDYDMDGDLDVYLYDGPGPDKLLRNNLDGTWTDVTRETGEPDISLRRAVVTDFDRDGDPDIIGITRSGELVWRSNLRQGRFKTVHLGVSDAVDVAAADINSDGLPDLVVATKTGIKLLVNTGGGAYEIDPGGDLAKLPAGFVPRSVAIADLDNDGFPDVIIGGNGSIAVYRNSGLNLFTWWPIAPRGLGEVDEIVPVDADHDGALDLVLDCRGKTVLLHNDGGNANNWLDVTLRGLATGSGKVNREGVGSLVEIKAGDLYVAQTVAPPLPAHFGLGKRSKTDVVRVLWTNGVPQDAFDQKARVVVTEVQELKGSCPFVYAYDGVHHQWNFISDALGRSPIGLLYDGVHEAGWDSREWLKIPGGELSPDAHGHLTIDYTEELWEAAFLDMVHLIAVDHPAGTAIVPNERMIPGVLKKKIFTVSHPRPVRAAWEDGKDVTELLRAADHRYVVPGQPTRYQGIMTPHDLVLDLGPLLPGDRVMLYLNGWIFYTDTSINVSASQNSTVHPFPPELDIPDGHGGWKVAMPSFGFPAGKTKTMPVDLTGIVNPNDPRVRIRTTMQIYWDEAYVTVNDPSVPVRMRELAPESARLFFRGFSRRYRETPEGPELFDHADVSTVPHWADVPGRLTRYGDVTGLLQKADDRWVAFAGGDAVRIAFDARRLPPVPAGSVRDYILVSDGWDKDFDKNTVAGATIGPYPFHAMKSYPPRRPFPDPAFLREYLTRSSSAKAFFAYVREFNGNPIQ